MTSTHGWLVTATPCATPRSQVQAVQNLVSCAERGLRDVHKPILRQLEGWLTVAHGTLQEPEQMSTRWQTWPLGVALPSQARVVAVLDEEGEVVLSTGAFPTGVLAALRSEAQAGRPGGVYVDPPMPVPLRLHYPAKHTCIVDGQAHVTGDQEAVRLADEVTGVGPDGGAVCVKVRGPLA